MVTFELRSVAGGWEQARFGPSDQVDYALYDGATTDGSPVLASYDSVHTFLRLYDLARLERTTHPEFLGATLTEMNDGGDGPAVELSLHGATLRTTYPALGRALEAFFEALFPALDAETPGERPDLATFDVCVTELDRLYADVTGDA